MKYVHPSAKIDFDFPPPFLLIMKVEPVKKEKIFRNLGAILYENISPSPSAAI